MIAPPIQTDDDDDDDDNDTKLISLKKIQINFWEKNTFDKVTLWYWVVWYDSLEPKSQLILGFPDQNE